jgi:N-methylhydantoinase A
MILGLDIGGTHTDVVLLGKTGVIQQVKVLTDPERLFEVVWSGIQQVLHDVPREQIQRAVLSTTLCTNAIVQNRLAPVGMIVSGGPGVDPEHFTTGEHFFPVAGSIDHRGYEVQPIEPVEIEAIRTRLLTDGIRHVGVVTKFSVRNPKQELQIREILGDGFEYVTLGHCISGHLNFPRRIATAYLNCAVYPVYHRFFQAVRDGLACEGLNFPVYVLKADGGTMSLDASLACPSQTILSGPAASVMGSLPFAALRSDTLVLDIGGTTTDIALLVDQVPLLDPVGTEVGHFKTLIRSLHSNSLALGGDSTVRVEAGELRIGPDRSGPAMAYGGTSPTPTDALLVLGKEVAGDGAAAQRGMQQLAVQLGKSPQETSQHIIDEVCRIILDNARNMVARVNSKPVYTVHELLDGYQVNPKHILVLGGPAQHFAGYLQAATDSSVQVVPRWQVANAVGAAIARTTCEVTLFADTDRGMAAAPEENFYRPVKNVFGRHEAVELAFELLKAKAIREGADLRDLEMDLVEDLQFNMVRDFYTTGRNIRIKVQIRPGLIHDYRRIEEPVAATENVAPTPMLG